MEIKKEQLATLIQLQEKMEVIELQYAYVRSVDKRDWQTSLDVFHTDGKLFVVDSGERQLIGGKPEIESFFKEMNRSAVIS